MKAFDIPHFDGPHARRQLLLVSVAYLLTPLGALAAPPQRSTPSGRLLNKLRQSHPGTEFTAVRPTPITGWHEVWMGNNVAYVNEQHPRYFVFGRLFDTQKAVDLTSASAPPETRPTRQTTEAPLRWTELPLQDAFELRRGSPPPQRTLALFSDPQCGHCQALERELDRLTDVSVHVFPLPFQGEELPRALWCSPNRGQAWQQWMHAGKQPAVPADAACESPLARNLALAQRLGVRGTPTMFFMDGSRLEGAVTHQVIEERLERAATGSRS